MKLNHHAALRAIGGTMDTLRSNEKTEYWTLPEALQDKPDFYDMRETIPYANLLSGFRYAGFIVYLDKPRFTDALIDSAPDLLAALEAIIKMIGPYAGQGRMDAEIAAARSAIAKAKGD
jgi:hypothetical protein